MSNFNYSGVPTQNQMPAYHNANLRVVRFIMTRSGTYTPLYRKPYVSHVDDYVASELFDRIKAETYLNNAPAITISPTLFKGLGSKIIAPAHQHQGEIMIPNGWTTPRGTFIMVVEVTSPMGTIYEYHIQGYTNYYELSYSGTIDPQTQFYINSYYCVTRSYVKGPLGVSEVPIIIENVQVVNGQFVKTMENKQLYASRAEDIFTALQTNTIMSEYGQDNIPKMADNRIFIKDGFISSRGNNLSNVILNKLVESNYGGVATLSHSEGLSHQWSRARAISMEPSIIENALFRRIKDSSGSSVSFSMSDLLEIDPNASHPSIFKIIDPSSTSLMSLSHHGDGEHWSNPSDYLAHAATIIKNSLPTLMINSSLSSITFSANNHSHGGVNQLFVADASNTADLSMHEYDFALKIDAFKISFFNDVMYDLTDSNRETYSVEVSSSLIGDTIITLQIGNLPEKRFIAPQFCDSLSMPVISNNYATVHGIASDMERVFNEINNFKYINTYNCE